MRNALRFLSLLLVCVLAVGLWAPAAKADMCYEVIKRFFENADNENVTYLGKGTRFETEPSDYVIFMADTANEYVVVTGTNSVTGRYEGYAWYDVTAKQAFLAFIDFCLVYEDFNAMLDYDKGLHGVFYVTKEDDNPYIISSAVEAAAFIDYLAELASE